MKYGCCCRKDHINILAKAGFDYVELSAHELYRMGEEEFQDTLRKLDTYQIPCLAVNDYSDHRPRIVGKGFGEKEIREYARTVCARAAAVGAHCIGIGSPNARVMPVKYSYYRAFEQGVKFLQIVAEEAALYDNLNIAMEALNYRSCNFCNTQQQALDIVTAARMPNIKLEMDFYHMEMMAESFESFGKLKPYIAHLHISEKNIEDVRCCFELDNTVILEKASKVLAKYGYAGNISLEVPADTLSDRTVENSLLLMKKYLD